MMNIDKAIVDLYYIIRTNLKSQKDMDDFADSVMHQRFSKVYLPEDKESELSPYAFLVNDSILITMET